MLTPNKPDRANRRHAAPLNAGRQFERAFHPQPCSPAAVALRSLGRISLL